MTNQFSKSLKLMLTLLIFTFLPLQIHASGVIVDGGDSGLDPIELPTFLNLDEIKSFSVFSYISLIINLIFILLVLTWVTLAIRAAYMRMRSEGNDEMISNSTKRFQRIFSSISMLFIFFIVITLASSFLGFGTIFDWPKQFSLCKDGSYYFTVQLELVGSEGEADRACFDTNGASEYCSTVRDSCLEACQENPFSGCSTNCSRAHLACINRVTNN